MSWLVSTNNSTFILQHLYHFGFCVIACLDRQMSTSIYDKITPPNFILPFTTATISVGVHTSKICAKSFRLKVFVVLTFDLPTLFPYYIFTLHVCISC